jgi:hypothetical protein
MAYMACIALVMAETEKGRANLLSIFKLLCHIQLSIAPARPARERVQVPLRSCVGGASFCPTVLPSVVLLPLLEVS